MALVGLIAGVPGAVCGVVFDAEHRWIWALFVLASIAFAGWIVFILRRGAEPLPIMPSLGAWGWLPRRPPAAKLGSGYAWAASI